MLSERESVIRRADSATKMWFTSVGMKFDLMGWKFEDLYKHPVS